MPIQLPDDLAGRYLIRRSDRSAAIVRADFADGFDRAGLIECADARTHAYRLEGLSLVGGRTRAGIVPAGALGEAVVRPYRRGGLARRLTRDRYFLGRRAFDELILTERLRLLGVPVPEALAAVHSPCRPGYRACLVTRRLLGSEPAAQVLRQSRPGECRTWMEQIGKSVRLLHEAGGWHADLNANNILLAPARTGVPAILVDFDRGRLFAAPLSHRRARRNLRRLRRSLKKLRLLEALRSWPAFEQGYSAERAPEPAA